MREASFILFLASKPFNYHKLFKRSPYLHHKGSITPESNILEHRRLLSPILRRGANGTTSTSMLKVIMKRLMVLGKEPLRDVDTILLKIDTVIRRRSFPLQTIFVRYIRIHDQSWIFFH